MQPRILVTGANGFVGRALCARLVRERAAVRAAVRSNTGGAGLDCPHVAVGEIGPTTDWAAALDGIDVVVHLAARAHVMDDRVSDPLASYRRVNVAGTASLATQAVGARVRRIVYLSSIKVNGEVRDAPGFSEADPPRPEDAYGISKLEAERSLAQICAGSATEFVVLRPPLIYGPGVKGNLFTLMRAIDRGIPLPFGCIRNRRSLLGIDNLVSAIALSIAHPGAANRLFMVSDARPVSTAELARVIARALARPARLLPVPPSVLRVAGVLSGRTAAVSRLTSSLMVDARAIRDRLGWQPETLFEPGVQAMVEGYLMVKDTITGRHAS